MIGERPAPSKHRAGRMGEKQGSVATRALTGGSSIICLFVGSPISPIGPIKPCRAVGFAKVDPIRAYSQVFAGPGRTPTPDSPSPSHFHNRNGITQP